MKASLVALAAFTGMTMWANRDFWIDAYSGEREPTDLTISALDLSFRADSSGPSPFQLDEVPDTRHHPLPFVGLEAAPVAKVTVQGGSGELKGLITGPTGPLAGAEVVIQRFTNDGAAVVSTQTNAEGRWRVRGVRGGRFRVRAFVPGEFGSSGSEVFFLGAGETRSHDVNLAKPSDVPIVTGLPFGEAFVGGQGTAIVFVAHRIVDENGRVQQVAAQGVDVTLVVDGVSMVLTSSPTALSDSRGYATFSFSCAGLTTGEALAQINDTAHAVAVTPCQAALVPAGSPDEDPAAGEPSE